MKEDFRCGCVAILGRPNVGKSTLLNSILGAKLSITSRKPHTTRQRLLGIHTTADAQYLFLDTPGFQNKHSKGIGLDFNKIITHVVTEADVLLLVVEAAPMTPADQIIIELLPNDKPILLVVNKSDMLSNKTKLLPLLKSFSQHFTFAEIVPVSAKNNLNLQRLLTSLRQYLPVAEAQYDADTFTDRSERFLAHELVREKIFRLLGDEIPYAVTVLVEKFEIKNRVRRIFCVILVAKAAHKPILIGADGKKLKEIASSARLDMERVFGGKVYLEVWVKVKKMLPDNSLLDFAL